MKKKSQDLDWIDASRIGVATPCHVDWETMTGDERKRFCGNCQKSVYNLSDMPEKDATAFLTAEVGAGRVPCIQFYKRADGTILFDNCPVALRAVRDAARRTLKLAASFVSLCLSVASAIAMPSAAQSSKTNSSTLEIDYDPLKAVKTLVQEQLLAQGIDAPESPTAPSNNPEKKVDLSKAPRSVLRGDYVDPSSFAGKQPVAKPAPGAKKVTIVPGCSSGAGQAAGLGTGTGPAPGIEAYPVKGEMVMPRPVAKPAAEGTRVLPLEVIDQRPMVKGNFVASPVVKPQPDPKKNAASKAENKAAPKTSN